MLFAGFGLSLGGGRCVVGGCVCVGSFRFGVCGYGGLLLVVLNCFTSL